MFKMDFKFDALQLDSDAYTKAIDAATIDQMYESARAFLRATLARIPQDTSMAAGSFLNLGKAINEIVPLHPKSFGKRYYDGATRLPKNAQSGARLSAREEEIFVSRGHVHSFEFFSAVRHLKLLDPTRWHATEAGIAAFLADFNRNIGSKIPPIDKFIRRKRVA